MSDRVPVCRLDEVPPGCIRDVVANEVPLALYNVAGEIHATFAYCPHEGGPLTGGILEGHLVVCPWHQWRYDVRTGIGDHAGALVDTYEVFVEDGQILIGARKPFRLPSRPKARTGGG